MVTSTSSASGMTSTPAAEVWMRPWLSVTGTRCTRCTPPSYFSRAHGASPGCGGALGLHRDLDVLVAAEVGLGRVDDLGLPATALGVPQVHPQQVAGEQRRLLAALPRLDLEDHVAVVVGVARDEQPAQLVLGRGSRVASSEGTSAAKLRVLLGQLARSGQVVGGRVPRVVGRDGRAERGIPLVEPADDGSWSANTSGSASCCSRSACSCDEGGGGLQHGGLLGGA